MKEKAWKSLCLELGSVGTGSIQHADMPECKVLEISWHLWISPYLHNVEQRTFSLRHSRSRLWQQVGLVNPRQMWLSWRIWPVKSRGIDAASLVFGSDTKAKPNLAAACLPTMVLIGCISCVVGLVQNGI